MILIVQTDHNGPMIAFLKPFPNSLTSLAFTCREHVKKNVEKELFSKLAFLMEQVQ